MESKIKKPWGTYTVLQREPGYWIKQIIVNPSQRLSLQFHKHRSEEWVVVKGNGTVFVNGQEIRIREGSHIHIGIESTHRITNDGLVPLIFIEIALGTDLKEDDIVRLDDDYGRDF